MRKLMRLFAGLALTAAVAMAAAPRLTSVEPDAAKPGTEVTAHGQNLEAGNVVKLFLTVGNKDIPVEIKDQKSEEIRFAIPADAEMGRYNLMLQTAGPSAALLVQPVACEVVDDEELKRRKLEEEEFTRSLEEPAQPEAQPEP